MRVRRTPSVIPRMRTTAHPEAPTCPGAATRSVGTRDRCPCRARHGPVAARYGRSGYRVLVFATRLLIATTVLAVLGLLAPDAEPTQAARFDAQLVATYDTDLHLTWATRRLRIATRINVTNDGSDAVSRLELNTLAAKLGGMRRLRVRVDGLPVTPRVTGQTIRVALPVALPEGGTARIDVSYRARLGTSTAGRDFLWSKVGGIAHIYRSIPWISRQAPYGPSQHGEPFVTGVSPLVRVDVDSDRPLVWATSGERTGGSGRRSTFVARNVRDFNLAVSPSYRTKSARSRDGRVKVVVHTRTIDPDRLIGLVRNELARFQRITGVPYPYPIYRAAESGGGLAMESPSLIWIPGSRSRSDQAFLVAHETAHQWFYAIVGNDQLTDPFADEALAEYFSRKATIGLRGSRCAQDRLDKTIHRYRAGCYYETVYVQGALFLDGLRRDFGNAAFRRAIRRYAEDYRLGMGSNRRLLDLLRDEMGNGVMKRYRARFPSLY
jgi:hypothetical protein